MKGFLDIPYKSLLNRLERPGRKLNDFSAPYFPPSQIVQDPEDLVPTCWNALTWYHGWVLQVATAMTRAW